MPLLLAVLPKSFSILAIKLSIQESLHGLCANSLRSARFTDNLEVMIVAARHFQRARTHSPVRTSGIGCARHLCASVRSAQSCSCTEGYIRRYSSEFRLVDFRRPILDRKDHPFGSEVRLQCFVESYRSARSCNLRAM
jgi:hypothetical protein